MPATDQAHCSSSSDQIKLSVGEIVWATYLNFPTWPAAIVPEFGGECLDCSFMFFLGVPFFYNTTLA